MIGHANDPTISTHVILWDFNCKRVIGRILIQGIFLCAFALTSCGTLKVEIPPNSDQSSPGVPTPTQTASHPPRTPTSQEVATTPTAFEGSLTQPNEHGYLLLGSKDYQALRVLDLTAGGHVDYRTVEWSDGAPVALDSLVTNQGWIALRAEYGYLNLYQIPFEEAQHSIWLLNEELFKVPGEPDAVPYEQYYAVSNRWSAPKWSPVEPVLAFAAAVNDEWVSVYIFDTRTKQMTRLTPPGSHTLPLGWSPDGKQFAAVSAESINRNLYRPSELLIIDATQGSILVRDKIYVRDPLQILDWSEDGQLFFVGVRQDGRLVRLYKIDSSTGKGRMLYDGPFLDVAIDPIDQYAIISSPIDDLIDRIVLLDLRMSEEDYAKQIVLEGEVGQVDWYPELRSFAVECLCGTKLIGVDGVVREFFPAERGLPFLSPDGRWAAFGPGGAFYDTGLRVYSLGGELLLDSGMRAKDIAWWWDSMGLAFARSIGGIVLGDLETGILGEPMYLSGNDLNLVQNEGVPFSALPSRPFPTVSPTPDLQDLADRPTPTAPLLPDRILSSGTELIITELDMQDGSNGWALGRAKNDRFMRVLNTQDGGESWLDVTPPKDPTPSEEYLQSRAYGSYQDAVLFAFDSEQAWVTYAVPTNLAEVVIWRTMDGGSTWIPSDPVNIWELSEYGPWVSGYLPIAIDFADRQHGWLLAVTELPGLMMAADTILLRSEDGGQHWDFIRGSSIQGLEGFEFLDRNNGWMLNASSQPEWSSILRTNDAGEYWFEESGLPVGYQVDEFQREPACMGAYKLQNIMVNELFMVIWCDNFNLVDGEIVEIRQNWLYHSNDKGLHWRHVLLPVGGRPDNSLSYHFITEKIGWLLEYETGILYRTTDGGVIWEQVKKVTWEGDLSFIDHLNGWAIVWERGVSDNDRELSLVRTNDGGYTWEILSPTIE